MTLRQYLIIMVIATTICWFSWGVVINNVDPFTSSNTGFLFFYISLFLALVGTVSIIVFFLYNFFSKSGLPLFRYVRKSFSLALFLSSVVILLLYLQSIRFLNFWGVTIFILVIALIISFIISSKQNNIQTQKDNSFL